MRTSVFDGEDPDKTGRRRRLVLIFVVCRYCVVCPAATPVKQLTFNTLWANTAGNKLMISFLFSPENRLVFHANYLPRDNLHEMQQLFFSGEKMKMWSAEMFYPTR